jgi:hypothetical protein
MQLIHSHTLAGEGQGTAQFSVRLAGIAVDPQDRLLAIGDREVKRFSPEGSLELRFPMPDAGWSLAADGESIWIGMQGAICRFDAAGRLLSSMKDQNRLGLITGLAVNEDMLFAADATNCTIHMFRDGRWQREVGRDVNTRGFMIPNGVLDLALDTQRESFVVAHPQKHRVERYNLEGMLTHTFGRFGMLDPADFGGCCNPTNITTTPQRLIAVSEKAPPGIKLYDPEGKFVAHNVDGVFDPNTKNIDLAADRRGRLFATDPLRRAIEVFHVKTESD